MPTHENLRDCSLAYTAMKMAAADLRIIGRPNAAELLDHCASEFRRSARCEGFPSSVFEDITRAAWNRERAGRKELSVVADW